MGAWLAGQLRGIVGRYVELPPPANAAPLLLGLENCFAVGQILPERTATTKTAVIEELAGHTVSLGLVRDKHWFVGALIERENVMPTAVGNGVAFLHTLTRHPEQVIRPFMVLGRSVPGLDFAALDSLPTHLFFVLGLRYQELHLPWLTKLAQMLAGGDAKEELLAAPDAERMYEVLVAAERKLRESARPAPSA